MAFDFSKRLKDSKKLWNKAKERVAESGGGFQEYEDGRYLMQCVKLEFGESANGRFQVSFTWKFVDGDYEGKTKMSFQGLETEDGWTYFFNDLARLGFDIPEAPNEAALNAIAKEIAKVKPMARVVLKTKGEFQNLYINKIYRRDDDAEEMETEMEAEAEDAEAEEVEESEDDDAEAAPDAEDEPETEDVEDDEVALAVGMRVVVQTDKGERTGEVIEILADEGKARIRDEAGKVLRVPFERIEAADTDDDVPEDPEGNEEELEDEEEDTPPPTKKKAAKKTTPPPPPPTKKTKKR